MRILAVAVVAGLAVPIAAEESTPPKRYIEVPSAVAVARPADTSSRIICKRDVEIGSWVKGVRRCGTTQAWRDAAKAAQFETQTMRDAPGAITMEAYPPTPTAG